MSLSRRSLLQSAAAVAGAAVFPLVPRALATAPATPAGDAPGSSAPGCGIDVKDVLSIPEMEQHAEQCMSHMAWEFVSSGAGDELTLKWNCESYQKIRLRPRMLMDVTKVDTRVTLYGHQMPFPILLSPTGYQRSVHPEGEIATAKGAGATNTTWIVSTATTTPIEAIARAATAPLWFQLYIQPDRGFTKEFVQLAEAAGCQSLCLTVDSPVLGARNRQTRSNFKLPPGVVAPYMTETRGARDINDPNRQVPVTWQDVEWMRSFARIPILLKGILTGDDAEKGIAAGAQGIIVSNHGARNLDTTPATIDALPEVTARVANRVPVIVDGGIRRGTDVLKAIAHGATAVGIGRPYLFGLSIGGAAGVQRAIEILRTELVMAMQLTGRRSLAEIDRSVLWDFPAG